MVHISVGDKFPKYQPGTLQEGLAFIRFEPVASELIMGLFLNDIRTQEVSMFLEEPVEISISQVRGVSFLIVYWGDNFSFDTLIPMDDKLLSPERSNILSISLVDWHTGITKAIRFISVPVQILDTLKTEIERTINQFPSQSESTSVAQRVYLLHDTNALRARSIVKYISHSNS